MSAGFKAGQHGRGHSRRETPDSMPMGKTVLSKEEEGSETLPGHTSGDSALPSGLYLLISHVASDLINSQKSYL